jgi:precorrin-6B methylase 2
VQAALLQKEQVEVVDAGCGPLCLFGLIAASISPKVNVTAFETNPISAGIAERVAMRFGFANQIRVLRSDAASVQLDRPADIFVSETFDSGLMYESAAQIFRNLLPQLAVDARVIPTRLELNAKLAPYLSGSTADVSEADWSNICRFNLSRASIPATELAGSVSAAGLQPGKYQLLFSTALGFGGGISDLRYPIASPIVSPSARGVIRLDRALDHIDFSFTAGKLGLKLHTEGVELVSIRNIFEL